MSSSGASHTHTHTQRRRSKRHVPPHLWNADVLNVWRFPSRHADAGRCTTGPRQPVPATPDKMTGLQTAVASLKHPGTGRTLQMSPQLPRWVRGDIARADVLPPVAADEHQTIKDDNSRLFIYCCYFN